MVPELGNVPFGGKLVVLSGDFRQLPPVIPHGGRAGTVNATLMRHSLWKYFTVMGRFLHKALQAPAYTTQKINQKK